MGVRSDSKKVMFWVCQFVHVEEPDVTSPAALALLTKKLFLEDKSVYTEKRMGKIRNRWFKERMKHLDSKGGLTCAICGKQGLQPFDCKSKKKLATLDHVVDLHFNGAWKDPANFQVACYRCNTRKNARRQIGKCLTLA